MGIDCSRTRRPTQHARAEGAAQGTEAQHRALLDAIPDLIFRLTREGRFLDFSPAKGQEPALPPAEFLGRTVREVMPTGLAAEMMRYLEQALQTGDTQVFEYQMPVPLPNGNLRDFEGRIAVSGNDEVLAVVRDITERRRAEEALRDSEQRFRRLSEATLEGVFVTDDGDRLLDANSRAAAMLGYELSELIGMDAFGFLAPDCHDLVRQQVRSGYEAPYEARGLRKDGTTFPMELCGKTASYEGRQVRVGVMRDITERKRAEQVLRESEERFRRLAESSIDGIVLIEGSEVRFANTALVHMLGYESDEEVLGRPFTHFVSEGYRELMEERRRARDKGRDVPDRYELRALCKDGSEFDAEISVSTITYRRGWARLGVIRDITERKRAEEALRESEAKYRQIFEHVHDVFYRADMNGTFTEVSPSIEWWGYQPKQLIGVQVADVYENSEERLAFLSALLEQGRAADFEARLKTGDGRVIDASVSSHLLRDPDGVVVGIEGIARDVSEHKRAERALRQAEERLRSLVTHAPVSMFAVDSDGVFTAAEGETASLVGLRSDEYVGRSVFDMFRDVPEMVDAARRALAGEAFTTIVELQERTFEAKVTPVRDQGGKIKGAVAVGTDITDRHRAEEMLRTQRDLAVALSTTTGLQDTVRLCVQAAIRVSGLDSGCVYLADRSAGAYYLAWHEGLSDEFVEKIPRFEADSAYVRAAMTGKPIYTQYEKLAIRMDEPRRREGLRAMAAVPVRHQGEVIACLCVTSHSVDDIPFASRAALETVALRIGGAVARSRAEEALRESEERFRRLSEATLEGIFIHDGDRILDANPQAAATHGYELSEFIGMEIWDFIAPDCHDLVRQQLRSGYEAPYEARGLRKDGTTFPMELCGKTASYKGHQVRVGVMRDISERRRAEQALRESEERFRRLSEATFEGITIHDGERILDANPQAAAMLGYELSELIGMNPLGFLAPDCHDLVRQKMASGDEGPYEVRGLRKDGTTLPIEIFGKAVSYFHQGRQVRVGVSRDISERKRAEEALHKAREDLEAKAQQRMVAAERYNLTFRELTVLYLVAAGMADKEIAFQLGISPRTASKHVENILQKIGVASRTEASVRALREGLVDDAR